MISKRGIWMNVFFLIAFLVVIPGYSAANDYGGWFEKYAPVDCFVIDNLAAIGPVTIQYSPAEAPRLGKNSTLAESGKCYASDSSVSLIRNGKEETVSLTESANSNLGSYNLTYFDLGLDYALFNSGKAQLLEPIKQVIQNTISSCDNRVRVESHGNIVLDVDGYHRFNQTKEAWLLKDGSRIVPPKQPDYNDSDSVYKIANQIGCSSNVIFDLQKKVDTFLNAYLQKGEIVLVLEGGSRTFQWNEDYIQQNNSEDIQSPETSLQQSETEKPMFEWWWFVVGVILIVGAYFLGFQSRKRKEDVSSS